MNSETLSPHKLQISHQREQTQTQKSDPEAGTQKLEAGTQKLKRRNRDREALSKGTLKFHFARYYQERCYVSLSSQGQVRCNEDHNAEGAARGCSQRVQPDLRIIVPAHTTCDRHRVDPCVWRHPNGVIEGRVSDFLTSEMIASIPDHNALNHQMRETGQQ